MNINRLSRQNKGFALAVMLLIITALGATFTGIVYTLGGQTHRNEAEIAGWEAIQIGRAARIHVRNQIEAVTDADLLISGASSPREHVAMIYYTDGSFTPPMISVQNLIDQNLLPTNFARLDSGRYYNALGQEIRIITANFPIGGDPADIETVPTSYVYFIDNDISTPELVQIIVQGARSENVPVSSPLYSGGVNISGTCTSTNPINTGSETTVIWDSGCLDETEFTVLTGDAYEPGSFVLPAWRTVNFDARAMMRFPQPEQTALNTMRTDLVMANMKVCTSPSSTIFLPDDTGGSYSTICGGKDDEPNPDPTLRFDSRRSILNVNELRSANLIVDPQSTNDVARNGAISADVSDFTVNGDLTVTGDAKVFDGVTTVNQLNANRNIIVSSGGIGPAASTQIGNRIDASGAVMDSLSVENLADINAEISVHGTLRRVRNLVVENDLIAENLVTDFNASGGASVTNEINVANNTNILHSDPANPLVINGGGINVTGVDNFIDGSSYNTVTSNFTARNINTTSGMNVFADSADFNGNTNSDLIAVTNPAGSAICYGDCPMRTERDQCLQAELDGYTTYNDCMDALR